MAIASPAGNRKGVLDRHQEGLVELSLGCRDAGLHGLHQRQNGFFAELGVTAGGCSECAALDYLDIVTRKLVESQQLADCNYSFITKTSYYGFILMWE